MSSLSRPSPLSVGKPWGTLGLTFFALVAFAANSVLCRFALREYQLDPVIFTTVRLIAGALVLSSLVLTRGVNRKEPLFRFRFYNFKASLYLLTYAVSFSFAYLSLDTGVGALVLFGAVQLSLIGLSYFYGHKLSRREWLGGGIAFLGLIYLVYPSLTEPSLLGFVLMLLSGIAWGLYTNAGKGVKAPLRATAQNFVLTCPWIIAAFLWLQPPLVMDSPGLIYAALSGGIASGLGYAIWYQAVRNLSLSQAASFQLLVPLIAAVGGFLFLGEEFTLRFVIALLLVVTGIGLVILERSGRRV